MPLQPASQKNQDCTRLPQLEAHKTRWVLFPARAKKTVAAPGRDKFRAASQEAANQSFARRAVIFQQEREMEKSPVEILGEILDEVEGLRRTDARSHLPGHLIREAKSALEYGGPSHGPGPQLHSVDALVGRTVSHVFDSDLKRAQMLIICTDGAFVALDTGQDGDECWVTTDNGGWGKKSGVADYLNPAELVEVGLMTKEQQKHLEREQKEEKLKAMVKRHEAQVEAVKRELSELSR